MLKPQISCVHVTPPFTVPLVHVVPWTKAYSAFLYSGHSSANGGSEKMGRSEEPTEDRSASSSPTAPGYQRCSDPIHVGHSCSGCPQESQISIKIIIMSQEAIVHKLT